MSYPYGGPGGYPGAGYPGQPGYPQSGGYPGSGFPAAGGQVTYIFTLVNSK